MRLVWLLVLGACHSDSMFQYGWDDRRVLCSHSIDDLTMDVGLGFVGEQLDIAAAQSSVALLHAHVPEVTITRGQLEGTLEAAAQRGLDFVTFSELAAGPARAGLALCFDDTAVGAWYGIRDVLAQYGARVTFFVTRYTTWSADDHALLAELAAAGHDVQAHTVDHLNAVDYARTHGIAAYVANEVAPSIAVLETDGYTVTSFAFPFGASTAALDDAVLESVARVRVSAGSCPY